MKPPVNQDIVISADNVGKRYRLYPSPKERLKEVFHPFSRKYHREFWALKDVSIKVWRGDTLGILGANGSGKSTLLQIICGVLSASAGNVSVAGRISSLLELGAGFHVDYSGRENVYMNGAIIGVTEREMDKRFPDIEAFADIGDFIDQPVRTYSSGMFVRLAMAAALNVDPEIMIIDEALAVGDAYFQQKCITRLKQFQESGKTILFVSHDPGAIKTLCNRALLLEDGEVIMTGQPASVLDYYQGRTLQRMHLGEKEFSFSKDTRDNAASAAAEAAENVALPEPSRDQLSPAYGSHIETGQVTVEEVMLLDDNDIEIAAIESERPLKISIRIKFLDAFDDPHVGFIIRDRLGVSVFGTNTYTANRSLEPAKRNDVFTVTFSFKCILREGDYNLSVGVANKGLGLGNFSEFLFLRHGMRLIRVLRNPSAILYEGVVNLFPEISFHRTPGRYEPRGAI